MVEISPFRRLKSLSLEGCSLLTVEGLDSVVHSWKELQRLRVVSCNNIKDSEVTPALATLFSVLKELKWRPDSRSLLSSSLGETGMGKKGVDNRGCFTFSLATEILPIGSNRVKHFIPQSPLDVGFPWIVLSIDLALVMITGPPRPHVGGGKRGVPDYLWLHSDLVFSCKLVLKFDGLHLDSLSAAVPYRHYCFLYWVFVEVQGLAEQIELYNVAPNDRVRQEKPS
ncbi:F-box protein [Vitis vinifera]|uniref:F-box protein n=1 Tax=Vitis vinifera TaxID=29760 RepID=A0A438BW70_VITVI|nr:F-box protein [Vitis vinifera]